MKSYLVAMCIATIAAGQCLAGPVRPVRSSAFLFQMPSGPAGDPTSLKGQWFYDPVTQMTHAKSWEFHDDDFAWSINGIVQSITFDGSPASNIVAFTILATVINNLPSMPPMNMASNSHGEIQGPVASSYSATLMQTRIAAEFAVANMALLPSGAPPYYTDPVSGGTYYIEALNEAEWGWYCWTPGDPQHPAKGDFQVPVWILGDIPPGRSASVLMAFQISGGVMPTSDYRHSVIRASQQMGLDILYNRHTSLKISHWLDTLLVDFSGFIGAPPGQYQEPPPEYIYASDVSVFFDREFDFGDAPATPYPTLLASDGARHVVTAGVFLGGLIDSELDGQPDMNAKGDDNTLSDDEDGVVFVSPLTPGFIASVDVQCATTGFLSAWVDFDGNGSWADAGEQVFTVQAVSPGVNPLTFPVPATAGMGTTFARFRFTTLQTPISYTGLVEDGEVEDYEVRIEEIDFGDAWDQTSTPGYPTLLAHDGARHRIASGIHLGALIDAEVDGQPDLNALGDDISNLKDEDGVTFAGFLVRGSNTTFNVVASTNGWLNAWIDFNRNGNWSDSADMIASDTALAAGTNSVVVAVPSGAALGETFGRFRFSSYKGLLPTGIAHDGEVEDYGFTVCQPAPSVDIVITNITCCASNNTVVIKWNGQSPVAYKTQYANLLTTNTTWTPWGSYVIAAPYEQTNSITAQTQRFFKVTAPYTAP